MIPFVMVKTCVGMYVTADEFAAAQRRSSASFVVLAAL